LAQRWRRRLTVATGVALVLALVAVGAVVGLRWWHDRNRTDLQRAIGYAPADAVRFSWTDWAAVRARLHTQVDADSTPGQVQKFLDAGYDQDLTSSSAMIESTAMLQSRYGFSPADVDWELLSQSKSGSVMILGLPDSLSTAVLGDQFAALGYERPDSATGVWMGGEDLLGRLAQSGEVSPQFQYLALDPSRHLLLASDAAPYLTSAVDALDDSRDPGDSGLADVVSAVGEPLNAEIYTGDFACSSLAMAQADDEDQATADQLVSQAGGVSPLDGFAIAADPGDTAGDTKDKQVLVAMALESHDQATHDANSRARLASGPAPGQGGTFGDRFKLGKVTADGDVVTMHLQPIDDSPVVSDLSTGPVLFATC
jgi:hypothetical protein